MVGSMDDLNYIISDDDILNFNFVPVVRVNIYLEELEFKLAFFKLYMLVGSWGSSPVF